MRCSIRNRILLPLIAIQSAGVTTTALLMAGLAAGRAERQAVDRLNGAIDAVGDASFPHTGGVLGRMHGLSGAHFVAYDGDGRATGSSFPKGVDLPAAPRSAPTAARLGGLGDSPRAVVGGVPYFAMPLRGPASRRGASLLVLYPETSWRRARWEAATPPILLGLGSLGAMAGVTSWIAHRVGVRIRRVERQVARIAGGDFRGLDLGRERDEVQDLARSINRMAEQLADLRRTVERSERDRLLGQLAGGLAHQIRNSLTGARMSVQLHARRHPAPAGDRSLDVALRQLEITEDQVKGLLALGRAERRPFEPCDVGRLLDDVAALVDPACRHSKVTLVRRPAGPPAEILADPGGVRATVLNLLLNAIEAAGPGGRVGLAALPGEAEVTIEVVDDGPGPPPELADDLWEPFVTGKPEGVGLGLALAHRVAQEHGGRVSWARDGGETRFALTLPRSKGGGERAWPGS